jgi:hypothetical protein
MAGNAWASCRRIFSRVRRDGRGSLVIVRRFWGLVLLAVVAIALAGGAVSAVTTATASKGGDLADAPPYVGGPIQNFPPQAAGVTYGPASGAAPYAYPGGLVVAGRDNYQEQAFKTVSAAGGTVLIYLDAVIDNPHGRYHDMLINQSQCGPATSRWPGSPRANSWGYLNDFRKGSVLQQKLPCVLETMVAENPHMAGWFADDLGSRSWFPGIRWASFGSANQQAYREGAIAMTQTFRDIADRHGLIFLVNGTWAAGSVGSAGGGYPNADEDGNALADGGFVEHHDGEIDYFGPYGCSEQWAAESPVTKGKAFNYAVTYTSAGRDEYVDSNCYAYVNQQADYDSAPPWGDFHPTGLPSRVTH